MEREQKIRDTLKILPDEPGVYRMHDETGLVIYVGKAKILKNRVRSYFNGNKDPKTTVLVSKVHSIDWIVTRNEYEALILENNLIKEFKPRYNINLKDGKTYPVIRITKEEFPRVFRTRRIIDDGSSYYGPFTQIDAVDRYLSLIEEHFPLRKCRGPLKKRQSPCLYFHIGRCSGPCADKISQEQYGDQVTRIKRLLSGKTVWLEKELQSSMKEAASALRFEEAARLRDSLRAVQGLSFEQQVNDFDGSGRDYIAWDVNEDLVSFVVLKMREGRMVGNDVFRTSGFADDEDLALQFFLQYYGEEQRPPAEVYFPVALPVDDLVQYCKESFGLKVKFPSSEGKRDSSILEMARENARQDIRKRIHDAGNIGALEELQRVLGLPRLPVRIEGFDIAHLHGKHTVAAMVSFYKGLPDNNHYRIFNIKSLAGGIDDYESIREAVARRYTRILNEELERPDLILIDGGKGQLSAAKEVLDSIDLGDIPLLALAKEDEEIFVPGRAEPYNLPEGNAALRVLQHVRDEAHRFGTTRNQKLRSGDLNLSTLEGIPGMGPKRAEELLRTWGSLEGIRSASPEQLAKTARLGLSLAQRVHSALNQDTGGFMVAEKPAYGSGAEEVD